jgi:hypothetical protein
MGSMTVGWLVHRVKGDAHEFPRIYQTREKAEADMAVLTGPGLKAGRSRASLS